MDVSNDILHIILITKKRKYIVYCSIHFVYVCYWNILFLMRVTQANGKSQFTQLVCFLLFIYTKLIYIIHPEYYWTMNLLICFLLIGQWERGSHALSVHPTYIGYPALGNSIVETTELYTKKPRNKEERNVCTEMKFLNKAKLPLRFQLQCSPR